MQKKIAYLTIDDAPSQYMQSKIDFLQSEQIPAIFFCRGELVEDHPEPVIYAIHQGFIIGNHAYDHPYFSDLSLEACFRQIQTTDQIVEAIYKAAGVPRPAKFFRFPYGDKGGLTYAEVFQPYKGEGAERKEAIQQFLRDLGYTQPAFPKITYAYYRDAGLLDDVDWYWTYDVLEWAIGAEHPPFGIDSFAKVLKRMEEDVPEGGRGLNYRDSEEIILTHDHPEFHHLFELIIRHLLEKDLVFQLPPVS